MFIMRAWRTDWLHRSEF